MVAPPGRRATTRLLLVAVLGWASGLLCACVSYRPLEEPARPATPVPDEVRDLFEYRPSRAWALRLLDVDEDHRKYRLEIYTPPGSDEPDVRGWFYDASSGPDDRRPAVVILPILAGGYQAERIVATTLAASGISSVVLTRHSLLFRRDRTPHDLMESFFDAMAGARRTVDWLGQHPAVDPDRLGSLGISLGGIMIPYLATAEPRLKAHTIIIGGGDLPHLVGDSWEFLVTKYRGRQVDRLGSLDAVVEEMAGAFRPDPLDLAVHHDPRRFFFVVAEYDMVVRTEYQRKLWEGLGRPEALFLTAGHYTTILHIPTVSAAMTGFFLRAFAEVSEVPEVDDASTPAAPSASAAGRAPAAAPPTGRR